MAVDIKKMVDTICSLTVLELSKLVKALRVKFGLEAKDDTKPDNGNEPNGDESNDDELNGDEPNNGNESANGDESNGDESANGDKPKHKNRGGGGGEKDPHNDLKNYIAENPSAVELNESLAPGKIEQKLLPTDDQPDVLFQDTHCRIAVEVKSRISPQTDLERGLFQCVKYKALLEARRIVDEKTYEVDAILAIECSLPKELISIRDKLGIKVIENVEVPSIYTR